MRKRILFNAAALTISNIVVRIIGLVYKIWLSRSISTEALGLYQLAMPIYIFFISFAATGLPNALSRQGAHGFVNGNSGSVLRAGLRLSIIVSLTAGAVMLVLSPALAWLQLKDVTAWHTVAALVPAVVLGGPAAALAGYYHAAGRSVVIAVSEMLEQTAKVISVIAMLMFFGGDAYLQATKAALGISVGAVISLFTVRLCVKVPKGKADKALTRQIADCAVPLTANRLLTSFLSMITASIIPARLAASGLSASEAISRYGVLTGMAMPIVLLPCTVTSAVCVLLLPEIAKNAVCGNYKGVTSRLNKALTAGGAVCVAAMLFIILTHNSLGTLLYKNDTVGKYMLLLCPCTVFSGINQILATSLTALGKEKAVFRISLAGACFTLACTFVLPALPLQEYGIILTYCLQGLFALVLHIITLKKAKKHLSVCAGL